MLVDDIHSTNPNATSWTELSCSQCSFKNSRDCAVASAGDCANAFRKHICQGLLYTYCVNLCRDCLGLANKIAA